MATTLQRLLRVLRETLDLEQAVGVDTSREDVEAWDSVAHVELVLAIESEFDVSLTPDEITAIGGVRDALRVLDGHGVPTEEG